MRVVHEPDGVARELATDVDTADTAGEQARGLMFRSTVPEDYALVFRFSDPPWWTPDAIADVRSVHMLFVRVPLDVVWARAGRVRKVETLRPWRGFGLGRADTIYEFPAGAASEVAPGDELVLLEE